MIWWSSLTSMNVKSMQRSLDAKQTSVSKHTFYELSMPKRKWRTFIISSNETNLIILQRNCLMLMICNIWSTKCSKHPKKNYGVLNILYLLELDNFPNLILPSVKQRIIATRFLFHFVVKWNANDVLHAVRVWHAKQTITNF